MANDNTTSATTQQAAPSGGIKEATPANHPKGGVKKQISMMAMAIMIVTTVLSMRGLASQAEFGFTSIFYYVFAAVVFLVPYALVCAELASTYTRSGGVFRWVSEAFGTRVGWLSMYLEWQMVVIWFPAVLMFGAVSLAYIFWPEAFDAKLAANRVYTLLIVLGVYWLCTFNTFRGMKYANKLSTLGGLFGTIIPAGVLIVMGVVYLLLGKPVYLPLDKPFWPDFSQFGTIVLAASIFLFYAGMEIQAVQVPAMKNPAKNFPKSIFVASLIILAIFILGTLAIGVVIPESKINLLQSLLVAYDDLWTAIGVPWLGNVMALMITFGVLGQVSVVIAGPSTGILAVGKAGYLPRALQHTNKNGIQTTILYIQAAIVTLLSLVLVLLPSVESAYQILSQMSTIIYLIMVVIIYMSFVRLRHTAPNKTRGFRVPGGKFGMWLVTILGVAGAVVAGVLSFIPPSQIKTGSPAVYVGVLILGVAVFIAVPLIVYAVRKKSWRDSNANFYPFDWQIEGREPSEVSKWTKGYQPTDAQVQAAYQKEDEGK